MMAVMGFPGRERTAFCDPVPFRALGSRPVGPYGAPDGWEHCVALRAYHIEELVWGSIGILDQRNAEPTI